MRQKEAWVVAYVQRRQLREHVEDGSVRLVSDVQPLSVAHCRKLSLGRTTKDGEPIANADVRTAIR